MHQDIFSDFIQDKITEADPTPPIVYSRVKYLIDVFDQLEECYICCRPTHNAYTLASSSRVPICSDCRWQLGI